MKRRNLILIILLVVSSPWLAFAIENNPILVMLTDSRWIKIHPHQRCNYMKVPASIPPTLLRHLRQPRNFDFPIKLGSYSDGTDTGIDNPYYNPGGPYLLQLRLRSALRDSPEWTRKVFAIWREKCVAAATPNGLLQIAHGTESCSHSFFSSVSSRSEVYIPQNPELDQFPTRITCSKNPSTQSCNIHIGFTRRWDA